MSAVSYSDFVAAFPVFDDEDVYPPKQVEMWLEDADLAVNTHTFGARRNMAMMLLTAHNLTLEQQNAAAVLSGGSAGTPSAVVSSKSVGPASVSYDTTASMTNAGIWNTTQYGQRLYRMMLGAAQGGFYVAPGPRRMNGIGRY